MGSINVKDLISMGVSAKLNELGELEFVLISDATDWILLIEAPYMDVYINVASIEGNLNTVAYKYVVKDDRVRHVLAQQFGISGYLAYCIDVKHYNAQFTAFNYVCASYYDNNGSLLKVKGGNSRIISIEPNSIDESEAESAKFLWRDGEDFIAFLRNAIIS